MREYKFGIHNETM